MNDNITKDGLKFHLKNKNLTPLVFVEVTSTNALLREYAEEGANEGQLVIAASQTAGRGRLGRAFFSPPDTGIYMSLLLKPRSTENLTFITTAAAVAAAKTIDIECGVETGIKWVNDIYIKVRKAAGILTEAAYDGGKLKYVVLGIGINVYPPSGDFPSELDKIAGYVTEKRQKGLRERLAASICDEFMCFYEGDIKAHVEEYRRKSIVTGHNITVIKGDKSISAYAEEISDSAGLIVRYGDGSREELTAGEVSLRLN